MTPTHLFADRTRRMGANAIREILKVATQPGMISLAGGVPAPESFPMGLMADLTAAVMDRYGAQALQYDRTEGFGPLREALSPYLAERGVTAAPDEILVTSGSQGVLDAAGKIFISKGDRVAVEAPTYLGALSAFNPYEPDYVSMATDAEGLIPESLDAALADGGVKFVYLVPTFQNPTGRTLPLDRRKEIARIIQRHGALLVEDDPYGALRYRGEDLPPIQTFAPENVVYVSTLSKVFAPGLRIGFCVAPEAIRRWLVLVKQGTDLHTSTFNQALAAEFLAGGHLQRHLPTILDIYRPRQAAMLDALDRYFPEEFRWSRPDGGMFIWVEGPEGLDMEAVYRTAVKRNVAFVPGKFFYAREGDGIETMRLNFTMAGEAELNRAVKTLADVAADWTEERSRDHRRVRAARGSGCG
jgi:2-aminoadipate transaminase